MVMKSYLTGSVERFYCPKHGRVMPNDEDRCPYCQRPTDREEKEVD